MQMLIDKYQVKAGLKLKPPATPANAGLVLVKEDGSWLLDEKAATEYQSPTATCMYMVI